MLDARFHQATAAKITKWQCCNCREGGIGRVWADDKLAGCHNCGQKFNVRDLLDWNLNLRMAQRLQKVKVLAGPTAEWAEEMDRLQAQRSAGSSPEEIAAKHHEAAIAAAQHANRVSG